MSNRKYLDNSENTKPDQLPQTGEQINGKNAAHVKVLDNVLNLENEVLLESILTQLKIMNVHLAEITNLELRSGDEES
mgnify:CR=1 FL=1